MNTKSTLRCVLFGTAAAIFAGRAMAETATPMSPPLANQGIAEVVVTAQKRSQSLSDVPMSIIAQTGAQLAQRGVLDTSDLAKVVSGFVFTTATFGEPVYTLRGVGLYDSGIASSPTVIVYVDQVPLPFSVMTAGAGLDLDRVEVLKGPQGTLFGTNNTGGAINYIAAKPTSDFRAGAELGYESFNKFTASGYVSGPLTSTLEARVAVKAVEGGAWQYAVRDPNETLGDQRLGEGRILLDWTPTDRLKVAFNLNGFSDRGDTQTSQLQAYVPSTPGPGGTFLYPQAASSPIVNSSARAANWAPDEKIRKNNFFLQGSMRADYKLTDSITVTSLTSYSDMHVHSFNDIPGDQVQVESFLTSGYIHDFNQELRLSGNTDKLQWVVGGVYEYTGANDIVEGFDTQLTINDPAGYSPPPGYSGFANPTSSTHQIHDIYAAFANLDYKLTPKLDLQGGLRLTQTDQSARSCSYDLTPGSGLSNYFSLVSSLFDPANTPVGPRGCYAINENDHFQAEAYHGKLDQGNLSYRVSADYKFDNGIHAYVSDSLGYKAGLFTNVAAADQVQNAPVKQEELNAYEAGVKAPLFDRTLTVNAAAFYYDYTDKQVRARINSGVFGLLETMVTVPHSYIYGIDADFQYHPFRGLTISGSGTYLDSDIDKNFTTSNGVQVYDEGGHSGNFKGSRLPYAPDFTANADVQYEWATYRDFTAMVGASVTYEDVDNTTFQANGTAPDGNFKLPSHTVLDLRAGLTSPDRTWHVQVYGRNVNNDYYWTQEFQATDTRYRIAAMPTVFGVTVGHTF